MEPVEAGGAKAHLCERLDRVTRLMPEVASEPPDIQAVIDEIKEFRKGRILNSSPQQGKWITLPCGRPHPRP